MKILKTILLILAFSLIGNGAFAQSKPIKINKKNIKTSSQSQQFTPVSSSEVKKEQPKTTKPAYTQPKQTAPKASSNSSNSQTKQQPKKAAPAKPIKASGNQSSIPANSVKKGESKR